MFKLILIAPEFSLYKAFQASFSYLPRVEIVQNYFEWLTTYGGVPYTEAARQMALAYDHFIYPPKFINCCVAASRQLQIWEG